MIVFNYEMGSINQLNLDTSNGHFPNSTLWHQSHHHCVIVICPNVVQQLRYPQPQISSDHLCSVAGVRDADEAPRELRLGVRESDRYWDQDKNRLLSSSTQVILLFPKDFSS